MADHSAIEWTDATWNPITGCSVVSPGCANCYAMKLAGTRMRHHWSREGLTQDSKAGPVWNGQVRLNREWIDQPLHWRTPRRIFVCAHGDLFHESVPDDWIDRVFAVMALAPWHTFQVLTKRSQRMRVYLSGRDLPLRLEEAVAAIQRGFDRSIPVLWQDLWSLLSNVWVGVSAEDQRRADERIPDLLETPAAIRFVSLEPLLGPIVLGSRWAASIDWVIVGGESGRDARPMHSGWVRSLRDELAHRENPSPFFFKQWGEWHPTPEHDNRDTGCTATPIALRFDGMIDPRPSEAFRLAAGGEPGWIGMCRLGKKAAGRLLDGIEHNGMPDRVRP